jgi:hypothetical protein
MDKTGRQRWRIGRGRGQIRLRLMGGVMGEGGMSWGVMPIVDRMRCMLHGVGGERVAKGERRGGALIG